MADVLGGSYNQVVYSYPELHNYEAHHVWAKAAYISVTGLSEGRGPAIKMEEQDHWDTKSYDHNEGAKEYRQQQRQLLEQGKFREAWMIDVSDIRTKYSDKYDQHIVQAEKQLLKLEQENKIKLEDKFKQELKERQEILKNLEQKQQELEKLKTDKEIERKQEQEKDKPELDRIKRIEEEIKDYKAQLSDKLPQQKEQEKVSVTEKNNEIKEQISKYERDKRAYESIKCEQIENEVCKQQQAQLIDKGRYKEAWLVRAEELKESDGTYISVAKREGELLVTFPEKFDPDFRHSMQERQNLVILHGLDSHQVKKAFEDEFDKTLINRNELKEARQAQVEYVLAKQESEKIKTEHHKEILPSVIIEQNQQRMTNATRQVVSAYQKVELTHELENSIKQEHKNYYSQSL